MLSRSAVYYATVQAIQPFESVKVLFGFNPEFSKNKI